MATDGAVGSMGTAMPDAVPPVDSGASLSDLARWAGVALEAAQLSRFDGYRSLLLDRGSKVNLTAISDPEEVDRRLFLDALRMVPALDEYRRLAGADSSKRAKRLKLVDVGSGAGFPGLVLKIARPDLEVTLIEATGKKATFLQDAIAALELDGVVAIHARAEDLAHDARQREKHDLATARAVAALPALLELCAPLLRLGGRAFFPKGLEIGDELAAGQRAAPLVGARLVASDPLPGSDTRLVIVEKTGLTHPRYPRRAGIPAREPLGGNKVAKGKTRASNAPTSADDATGIE